MVLDGTETRKVVSAIRLGKKSFVGRTRSHHVRCLVEISWLMSMNQNISLSKVVFAYSKIRCNPLPQIFKWTVEVMVL